MNAKPIYFFILSFAACLVTSCSGDVPDIGAVDNGCEVTFDVADRSRASVTGSLNFAGSEFAIYGDMKYLDNNPTVIFDKTIVKYQSGQWRYEGTQYWFPKHEHSFIAVHPVDITGFSDTDYSDSRLTFTYTLPENYQSAQDLMVATHRRMYGDNIQSGSSSALLSFWHILSRINFKVKDEGAADIVRVTEIVLEGVNKKGTFSIIPAPVSSESKLTDDCIFSWTDISEKGDLTANISVDIPENEVRSLFPDNNALLMIPQPDNKEVIMKITYTLIDSNAKPQELTLTAQSPIGGWLPGKEYTYNIAICEISKEIYLTVSVKDWQTPNPTGVTVPES